MMSVTLAPQLSTCTGLARAALNPPRLEQFRAVATGYDKRDFMYQATVDVASIRIWLRDPVP
jgi:transposase